MAKAMRREFLDIDLMIQTGEKATLSELIERHGLDGFCEIEKRYAETVTAVNAVIATGGSDGLQGVKTLPLFGLFKFDLYGTAAYAYSLGVLFLVFLGCRRLINSPFGLALRGIRENWVRMPAIGADSRAHIRKAYTIAATIAGICGALLAQTTDSVSLESISFQRSADVLVMLVLGGAGRLYGGLVGAAVFMVARDQFSGIAPQFWYFWIGILLVMVVIFLPNGIVGGLSKIWARWRHR
jgi:branched-chain amino acid transport system permease protein